MNAEELRISNDGRPSDGFEWRLVTTDHLPRLILSGDLDLAAEESASEGFAEAIAAANPVPLVVDLKRLEFLDCAGVRMLVSARNQLRSRGVDLVLRVPSSGPVARILEILRETGLSFDERREGTRPQHVDAE